MLDISYNREIWKLYSTNDESKNWQTLDIAIQNMEPIEKYGGGRHICDLYEVASYCVDWEEHLRIHKNRQIKKDLTEYLKSQLNKIAVYPSEKIYEITQDIHTQTNEFINKSEIDTSIKFSDIQIDFEELEKQSIQTGWYGLDKLTAGLGRGNLVIIGARSSMGKTAFACNMALQMAASKKNILFITLEMTKEQIFLRVTACNVGSRKFLENKQDFLREIKKVSEMSIYTNEKSRKLPEIMLAISNAFHKKNIDLVVIDYLQLIFLSDDRRTESRNMDIGYITAQLKAYAIKYNIPIVCLAQLNRLVEGRNDKRPMLSDLRDSGNIEQDADVVMLLYRDDYYHPDKNPGLAECIVAKNRHGNTGTVKFKFQKDCGRFEENTFPL